MSILMEREVTCAVCKEKSRQTVTGSLSAVGVPDLDGRPAPLLRNTMMYWLEECPNCGYIETDISLPAKKTLDKLKKSYKPFDELTDSPLAARFAKYACYLSNMVNLSGACKNFLYAAWVYDDMKKYDRARMMRRFALDFANDLADSMIRDERCYYILLKADLLRRMGRFESVLEMDENDSALDERDRWQMLFEKELAAMEDNEAHCLKERPELLSDNKLSEFLLGDINDICFKRQCIEQS